MEYARMAERPAATLLHLGPGLANGLANLHNARKAQSPVVNIVGNHATSHQRFEAPLTSDVEAFARTVSHWVHTSRDSRLVAADAARAVQAARQAPGQIATLILPADTAWTSADRPAGVPADHQAVARVRRCGPSGGKAARGAPWEIRITTAGQRFTGTRTLRRRPDSGRSRCPAYLRHVHPADRKGRRPRHGGKVACTDRRTPSNPQRHRAYSLLVGVASADCLFRISRPGH